MVDVGLGQTRCSMDRVFILGGASHPSHHGIDTQHQHTADVEHATDDSQPPQWDNGLSCFDEVRVHQVARVIHGSPHPTLHQAGGINRDDVEQDPNGPRPKVQADQFVAPHLGLEQPWKQPVQHAEHHEPIPTECTRVNVRDGPVGVVSEGVDRFDRQHRAFKSAHPVERHANDEELQHRISGDFVPRTTQSQQTIDHSAPTRHPQHQAEQHAQCAGPFRKCGVMQVVRTCPDVNEDQRPEVNDTELVTENRSFSGFGQEVIHQAQEWRRQEKRNRVVAVPPLHECVLDTRINAVAFEPTSGNDQVVEHVQQCDGHDRGDVEPQRDVHVTFASLDQRHQEVATKDEQPDDRDQQIDRPFEFRIFTALGDSQRKRDGR